MMQVGKYSLREAHKEAQIDFDSLEESPYFLEIVVYVNSQQVWRVYE